MFNPIANRLRFARTQVRSQSVLWAALVVICICTQLPTQAQEKFSGRTMGPVQYNVTLSQLPLSSSREEVNQSIADTLERVNQLMSTYIPESDVSRFNKSASTEWFKVDSETAVVVERALEISEKTNGAFDITVGPLVNIWNFGPGKSDAPEKPSSAKIKSILQQIGYQKLAVRANPPAIRKSIPDIQIDLSAIAKGYAVDRVAGKLRELGCDSFMVEVGGEVWVQGAKLDGSPWRIGVTDPKSEKTMGITAVAELSNQAMATSGDYRNFVVIDGKRYSHTIDPRTGMPVDHSLASVSIIATDCLTADALATAAMVMGVEKTIENANAWNVEAFVIWRDGDRYSNQATTGFPLANTREKKSLALWPLMLITLGIFVIALAGMSVGVIFSNRRIKGSCGGIASLQESQGEKIACSMCSNPSDECADLKKALAEKQASDESVPAKP